MESSASSYEKINYALRPAKAIERKMLIEIFSRLYPFSPVDEYQYIGFGSIYFTDFQIINRSLGLTRLISIEKDSDNAERFKLNLPMGCLNLKFGHSNEILPLLDWSPFSIVWLDYDGHLENRCLSDVTTVVKNIRPGSFFIMTVNANADIEPPLEQRTALAKKWGEEFSLARYRAEKFSARFEDQEPPLPKKGKELNANGLPLIYRDIVLKQIQAILTIRNGQASGQEIAFKQVVFMTYRDGAKMMTIGGMFVSKDQERDFEACRFSTLPFARFNDESLNIVVPCLTPREMCYLSSVKGLDRPFAQHGIPKRDVDSYLEIGRYFPVFSEVFFS